MSNWWNREDDSVEAKKAKNASYLRSLGYRENEYGHWDDPNNVIRTGKWIDPRTGEIHSDM